jgi:hypothetical protein
MRFQVPQFIETETKLVGPMTLKQFLWVGSGAMLLFLSYMIFPLYVFIPVSILVTGIFGALAFVKIDSIPLFNYVIYALSYSINQRKYYFTKKEASVKSEFDSLTQPRPQPKKERTAPGDGTMIFKMEKKDHTEKKSLLSRIRPHHTEPEPSAKGQILSEEETGEDVSKKDSVDKALEQINKF